MDLEQILQQIAPLPADALNLLKNYILEVRFPKGHVLLHANKIEKKLFFIKKGLVRAFSSRSEQDITFWFGSEGETILSMRNYVEQKQSYESIELLEACELYEINILDLEKLYREDIHIANWGRRLAEKELLKTELRWVDFEFLQARERYEKLMADNPTLLNRAPLKHIASYLGMTQVSLSRIRKPK